LIWLTTDELMIGDEHGNIYRANKDEQKLIKFNNSLLSDKQNDEVQFFTIANKQKFILAIAYKSGLVCICHVDLEKNQLNVLHKLPAESNTTICCSIQFAHVESPLDRSTLLYISYAHGFIRVCDYITGKVIGQMPMVKQSKSINATDPRCKTYYPLIWLDANTLLTGNLDGHLIKIDVRHSTHLEKSQLTVTPPVSGGKPIFSLAMKDETKLFTYSFHRKLCIYDLPSLTLINSLVSMPGTVNDIQACPLQTSCIALAVDTGNIGILDLSSGSSSSTALSFLWQSIPADVCRLAWHTVREGRVAYSTRLGHVGLYDTLTGRSRVVYDRRYTQPGSPTTVLWGPLVPNFTEDPTLAVLYSVGDGKFHRWDSPEKNCLPTDLTSLVQSSKDPIVLAAFSDDRKYLSILCHDGSLWIRSCPSLDAMHCLSINCSPTMMKYHPRYLLSSIEASAKQYWIAMNDKQNIRLINTLESESSSWIDLSGHTGDVECLAWSPCLDHLLASGSQDKTVRLWNVETVQPLRIYSEHVDVVTSVLFLSVDFNLIVSGSRDQSLHIWNTEQHSQDANQPIQEHIIDNEEETSSQNGSNKLKRHGKPRPNRAEREKKRATKMINNENNLNEDDAMISSTNSIMNSCNSLAYRLLWPSQEDRATVSDLSVLPNKPTLIERIKDLAVQSSDPSIYHMLYWSGAHPELLRELNKQNLSSYNQLFFWMAILNDSIDVQPLFDRILNEMKESHDEYILEFVSMMVKAKKYTDVLDYLIHHDHTECSLVLAILFGLMEQIRDRLSSLTQTEQA